MGALVDLVIQALISVSYRAHLAFLAMLVLVAAALVIVWLA